MFCMKSVKKEQKEGTVRQKACFTGSQSNAGRGLHDTAAPQPRQVGMKKFSELTGLV